MGFFTKKWDIHAIKTWPPGAFMAYDNRSIVRSSGAPEDKIHVGLGMVIANDGEGLIRVLWGANCSRPYLEYEVKKLNVNVISRVG
jgi:hypothetical protein